GQDGAVHLFSLGEASPGVRADRLRIFQGRVPWVLSVAFSPDGRIIASGSGAWERPDLPGELLLWDARSGRRIATLRGHRGDINSLAFSPAGGLLASGSND